MSDNADLSLLGEWTLTIKGPTGAMKTTLLLESKDGKYTGSQTGQGETTPIDNVKYENGSLFWTGQTTKPMKLKLEFNATVDGNNMNGKVKTGFMGAYPFTGIKV